MGTRSKKRKKNQAPKLELVQLSFEEAIRNDLFACVIHRGLETVSDILEQERAELCGARYVHDSERAASRHGYCDGELAMGGRRVSVRRPRVRTKSGEEVILPSWEKFSNEDPLCRRAVEQMVVGVSTRKYHRSLEETGPEIKTRGTSKSAVSRRFVALTKAKFDDWMNRDLSALELLVVMVDGIHFKNHVVLVAIGFDIHGRKHILGLWEGATENKIACKALLGNLCERGLNSERSMLFVTDGAKALSSAIKAHFGERALIQRCRVHKRRNIREHLPASKHASVKASLDAAYRTEDPQRAKTLLQNLAGALEKEHPGAAASVREGLKETLTVKSMELGRDLERLFSSTNAVENVVGSGRNFTNRVKRWRGGSMILRWMATAMNEAEKKFRRVTGYRHLHRLNTALRNNDRQLGIVDQKRNVA